MVTRKEQAVRVVVAQPGLAPNRATWGTRTALRVRARGAVGLYIDMAPPPRLFLACRADCTFRWVSASRTEMAPPTSSRNSPSEFLHFGQKASMKSAKPRMMVVSNSYLAPQSVH